MLIQISDSRWLDQPEAVYRRNGPDCWECGDPLEGHRRGDGYDHVGKYHEQWVARMPTGTLEWLSDDEYEALIAGIEPSFRNKPWEEQMAYVQGLAGMIKHPEAQATASGWSPDA